MDTNRLDLLPPPRRRALGRAYILRLATTVAIMGTVLAVISSALLIPTYTYLLSGEQAARARLAEADTALGAAQGGTFAKRLTTLEADARAIAALGTSTPVSSVVKDALTVPRAGVALSGVNYDLVRAGGRGVLTLSGMAATRNDLRAFQLALSAAPDFAAADLPVSSYAKDHDIPFTITVTLATSTTP